MKRCFALLLSFLVISAFAAEDDSDLPQPFDPTTLTNLMSASPFNRAINPSDTLVLTGLAYVGGKPIAHLLDTETKKTHVLSEKPASNGWMLVSAVPARDFNQAQVKIQIGGETVTIRSNSAAVAASRKTSSGGAPPPPPSGDRGRGPSEGDRGYSRGNRGPSKEDMDKFQRMSPEAQEKMRNFFRDNRDRFMSMNEDDRRNFIRSSFDKVYNEDQQRSGGNGAPPRPQP
ncbi:MAG: hypothetical protein JNJ83_11660 [Verrucomicrobiaceae bacterium]|nr:hypothetical protein [Verrucomicrobiaceae bacterium]